MNTFWSKSLDEDVKPQKKKKKKGIHLKGQKSISTHGVLWLEHVSGLKKFAALKS